MSRLSISVLLPCLLPSEVFLGWMAILLNLVKNLVKSTDKSVLATSAYKNITYC